MAQQSLTIKEIKGVIPPSCYEVILLKSWTSFLRTLFFVFLSQYLIFITPLGWAYAPLFVVLVLFAGLSFVGIFVLGHDCGHYSFSQKKWINDVVGTLCHVLIMNGFFAWRVAHDFHHRHTQVRGVDPDWPELLVTKAESPPWHQKLAIRLGVGSVIGLLVGFWVGMIKRAFFFFAIPQMKLGWSKSFIVFGHTLFSLFLTFFLLSFYFNLLGPQKFLLMYVLPAMVGTTLGALLTFLHHTHKGSYVSDRDFGDSFKTQVLGTWNVRFPRWMEWMWLDINIHLPHHLSIRIPWYHLKEAHHQLKMTHPELVQDKDFSLGMLRECWRMTDLEEVEKGLYQLKER